MQTPTLMQPNTEEHFVVIGQIGRPQGIHGGMRLNSYTQPLENILSYQPWLIQKQGTDIWEEFHCKKVEHHAKGMIIFLQEIDDRTAAACYTQANVAVMRHQLPALSEDEYYWSDLEGLNVKTQDGIFLGIVDHLFETGSNDVLVVKGEKTHLIPYLRDNTIINIDLINKVIWVNWDPSF